MVLASSFTYILFLDKQVQLRFCYSGVVLLRKRLERVFENRHVLTLAYVKQLNVPLKMVFFEIQLKISLLLVKLINVVLYSSS